MVNQANEKNAIWKQRIKILEYDRIDILEGIDINKTSTKKCDICHYWYFKDIGFKYKPCIFNVC